MQRKVLRAISAPGVVRLGTAEDASFRRKFFVLLFFGGLFFVFDKARW